MEPSQQVQQQKRKSRFKSAAFLIVDALIWLCVFGGLLWTAGAIYYLPFGPSWGTVLLVIAFFVAVYLVGRYCRNQKTFRAAIAGGIVGVYLLTLQIWPSNDRDWDPDHARVAQVEVADGQVEIRNFRNNVYRSERDYDVRYETRSFSLNRIKSVWLIVQRFAEFEGMAHVFLSFELAADPSLGSATAEYFSLSVEIRREVGEVYDPIRGLFRCYEITHVIGDERDLIGVRTVHRPNDRVYLYRFNSIPSQAQELFVRFAKRISKLQERPEFYHSLLNNCANGITRQAYRLTPEPINWLDSRIVFPGYSGELAFEKGLIGDRQDGQTFEAYEAMSRIDEKARNAGITDSFSRDIREPNRKVLLN